MIPSIQAIAERYAKGATQKDILDELKNKVSSGNAKLNAYIAPEKSQPRHKKTDKNAPLWGVPILMKDNICVEGEESSCSSKILQGFVSPYNATVVQRLLDAGAVIYGRANMDEFAFGSSCETSVYGPSKNPWDVSRVPGGSSGGSASAVAGGIAVAALGSDTGGSIRQPAALCGVVGLKPTYGRVSRYGLIAFASSLDQIGPITQNVHDCALIMEVIAGLDPHDSTTANVSVPRYRDFLGQSIKGLKIGIPKEYFAKGISPDVEKAVRAAIEQYKSLGAEIVENISMPHTQYAANVYYIVAPSEASSNLARFDGVRFGWRKEGVKSLGEMYEKTRGEGFGAEAKRRIILGTFALSSGYYDAYYLKAMKVRTKIKNDFDEAFKKCDALLTPTSPSTAFKLGEKSKDPLEMYLSDIYTISANLAGVPGLSLPCGFSAGMPIGLQLLGKPFDEGTLFKLAHAYEQSTDFHKQRPNV